MVIFLVWSFLSHFGAFQRCKKPEARRNKDTCQLPWVLVSPCLAWHNCSPTSIMIQTDVLGMKLQAKRKRSGYGLWAAYLTGSYTASLVPSPSQSTSLGSNKMFFVNKSSCISIMKSFSSTVVKDTLSCPLGEDCAVEGVAREPREKRAAGYL